MFHNTAELYQMFVIDSSAIKIDNRMKWGTVVRLKSDCSR